MGFIALMVVVGRGRRWRGGRGGEEAAEQGSSGGDGLVAMLVMVIVKGEVLGGEVEACSRGVSVLARSSRPGGQPARCRPQLYTCLSLTPDPLSLPAPAPSLPLPPSAPSPHPHPNNPRPQSNEEGLVLVTEAIAKSGHVGKIKIAMDCAASEFYDDATKMYDLNFKEPDNDGSQKKTGCASCCYFFVGESGGVWGMGGGGGAAAGGSRARRGGGWGWGAQPAAQNSTTQNTAALPSCNAATP